MTLAGDGTACCHQATQWPVCVSVTQAQPPGKVMDQVGLVVNMSVGQLTCFLISC